MLDQLRNEERASGGTCWRVAAQCLSSNSCAVKPARTTARARSSVSVSADNATPEVLGDLAGTELVLR